VKTIGDRAMVQVARRMAGQLHVDRDHDYRRTVFLAGSGRSGTTWLADIINYDNDYRYIFEPFHRHKVPACKSFRYRQYLRPQDRSPEYLDAATSIVTGRIRNLWTDKYNRKFRSDRRLVKDVRANLFLKWLEANFPGMPIVLLLRHPCAVASSRMKVDWSGGADLRQFLAQPALVEDHLAPLQADLAAAESDFERMIFFWCIENAIPLRQFEPGQLHVVFYEHLCLSPEREIERLFAYLGRDFDRRAMQAVSAPSSATRKDSAIVSGEDLISSWCRHITDEQVARAVEILQLFRMDEIYAGDPAPRVDLPDDALSL
jgi:hypothetical protein